LRRLLKTAASRVLAWTGCDRVIGAISGNRSAPLIVGYHRVVKDFTVNRRTSIPAMLITSRTFEQQIDWIARRYRITTLDEIGSHLESGEPLGERMAAITFDDGYADFYHNAFPILRRKGLPAAVFVVTDLIGRKEMQKFDLLYLLLARALDGPGGIDWLCDVAQPHALPAAARRSLCLVPRDPVRTTQVLLKELPHDALESVLTALQTRFPLPEGCPEPHLALDWGMLEEMSAGGITIGSHTRTHPLLTIEDSSRVREEVEGSQRLLQRWLHKRIDHFAYPDGRFNAKVVAAVRRAGYRFAYGVCAHRDAADPLLSIPRKMLWENSCLDGTGRFSSAVMSCNINGIFDAFERCRRDHTQSGMDAPATMGTREAAASGNPTVGMSGRTHGSRAS